MKTIKSISIFLFLYFLFASEPESKVPIDIEKYSKNVVHITAEKKDQYGSISTKKGFGFIIGKWNNKLCVLTAKHVVQETGPGPNKVKVRYFEDQGNGYEAKLVDKSDEWLDVALLQTSEYPKGLSWEKGYYCPKFKQGDRGWYIGLQQEWAIREVSITAKEDEKGLMSFKNKSGIIEGTSGAPLITRDGLVGMILNSKGADAKAQHISLLQKTISKWGNYWQLEGCDSKFIAKIISPVQNSRLGREFDYKVEIRNPNKGKYYYIVNEANGEFWPKSRVMISGDRKIFRGQSNEGGRPPNGVFYIVLFEVEKAEHKQILKWWRPCNRTGDCPGMQIDGTVLDRIRVKLQ